MPNIDITWQPSTGEEINLNDRVNTFVLAGMVGDLMPKFEFIEEQSPSIDGSIVTDVVIKPRDISIPVQIQGATRSAALSRARTWLKSMFPKRPEGKLIITSDGVTRVLNCRYRDGFSDDGMGTQQLTNRAKAMLIFRAGDPFYYSQNSKTFEIGYMSRETSFFPIPPMKLYNPYVFSTGGTITNEGDWRTWPIITIYGPGNNPRITNNRSGKKLELNLSLTGSKTVTINTHPKVRSVVDQDGNDLYKYLTPDSSMFALDDGDNPISVFMGNGNESSKIIFNWLEVWLTV